MEPAQHSIATAALAAKQMVARKDVVHVLVHLGNDCLPFTTSEGIEGSGDPPADDQVAHTVGSRTRRF